MKRKEKRRRRSLCCVQTAKSYIEIYYKKINSLYLNQKSIPKFIVFAIIESDFFYIKTKTKFLSLDFTKNEKEISANIRLNIA